MAAIISLDAALHVELQPELVYLLAVLAPGVDVKTVVEEVVLVDVGEPPGGLHHSAHRH